MGDSETERRTDGAVIEEKRGQEGENEGVMSS